MDFTGVIAYPVTPFSSDGQVDEAQLRLMISSLAVSGVDSIAVLGSSGSFAYLDRAERNLVVRTAVAEAAAVHPGLPVYAGVSAVGTREVLFAAGDAEQAGVSGVILSAVSYVPLAAEEVAAQTRSVAAQSPLPVCLYNNPGTTQFDFPVELVIELSHVSTVVALKDPGADQRAFMARGHALRKSAAAGFSHGMSGDTAIIESTAPADAWHSGPAALLPEHYVALRKALLDGDHVEYQRIYARLSPVIRALSEQRKLSSLHSLARACGWNAGDPRLPLLPVPGSQQRDLARLVDLLE